ncbi:uncharacterized protein BDW47DRAFT_133291 [Aspergillus candidus]|uniref:Uncharacterized protein n=1 Tax=Aspergillus candidus TaxID=41067 RepID=A0A2I2F5A7_ASPCN|nr:hypothetical protein BDW47DRAFT_133291 [Aspergillus candidus]PLB35807.1 hypothetical protein BDW47DRAFT_133291 [Aspergillus candidus]
MDEQANNPATGWGQMGPDENSGMLALSVLPDYVDLGRAYWDSLNKIHLTPRAILEFKIRVETFRQLKELAGEELPEIEVPTVEGRMATDVKVFARRGGPDLSSFRGLTLRREANENKGEQIIGPPITRVTAYDANFEVFMDNHGCAVAEVEDPRPKNIDELTAVVNRRRDSVAQSTSKDYMTFIEKAREEHEIERFDDVLLAIYRHKNNMMRGPDMETRCHEQLEDLERLNECLIRASPDMYDGAKESTLNAEILHKLRPVLQTEKDGGPILPNFFFDCTEAEGRQSVGKLQALHSGVYGARAFHRLQCFLQGEEAAPIYDGNAYTIAVVMVGYHLCFYCIAPCPPTSPTRQTDYKMWLFREINMKRGYKPFLTALAAFKNCREWAHQQRNRLISEANDAGRRKRKHSEDDSQGSQDKVRRV